MYQDFSLKALYDALDEQRRVRELSWTGAAREINRHKTAGHPISTSTITGLRTKAAAEGDGILQMLLWLGRTPESFIPGFPDPEADRFRLPEVSLEQTLRWDARAIHAALDSVRRSRGLTWKDLAREVTGFTPGMLTNLAGGGRVGLPGVMRILRWLDKPAASFTRPRPY